MTVKRGVCTHPQRRNGKLTVEQVGEIKGRLGTDSPSELAYAYGVKVNAIYAIINKDAWPEVEPIKMPDGDSQ